MSLKIRLIIALCTASSSIYSQSWSDVGGGVDGIANGQVVAMYVYDGQLYIGGYFTEAGGVAAMGIARWNGVQWDSVGSGVAGGTVFSFATYKDELFVGGTFQSIGGVANTQRIAKWDGSNWASVSGGVGGRIEAMAVYKGELYVGGNLYSIDGLPVKRIARWDGVSWKDVGGGVSGSIPSVRAMVVYNNKLYVGGEFITAGGILAPRMATWDSIQWDSVGSGFNGAVSEMVIDTLSNELFAGGGFTSADGVLVYGLANWDGMDWTRVDSIVDSLSGGGAMGIYGNELYVSNGQSITTWSGEVINYIGRWDGNQWRALGTGTSQAPLAMTMYNNEFYIAGAFEQAGGITVNYIARWDLTDTTIGTPDQKKKAAAYLGNSVPNPAKNEAIIPFTLRELKGIILLYGMKGELIQTHKVRQSERELRISLKGLADGTYLYVLEIEGIKVDAKRMVVAR